MERNGTNTRLLEFIGILMLVALIALTGLLVMTGRKLDQLIERQAQPAAVQPPVAPAPAVVAVEPQAASNPRPASRPPASRVSRSASSTRYYTQAEPKMAAPIAADPVADVVAPQPALVTPPSPQPIVAAVVPPEPKPQTVTIPAGTILTVRLIDTLHSDRNRQGDTFLAALDEPIYADGGVVLPRGVSAEGRVVSTREAGRVSGLSELTVELDRLLLSNGKSVSLVTDAITRQAEPSRGADAAKVGAGAAIGAAIGAIAGGGRGAGIGAATGAGASTAGVILTRGKPVILQPETRFSFRLRSPVQLEMASTPQVTSFYSDSPEQHPLSNRWDRERVRLRRRY